MACTIIRLVQAAVNLRRTFECAIQSSLDSMDGGEVQEEPVDVSAQGELNSEHDAQVQIKSRNKKKCETLSSSHRTESKGSLFQKDEDIEKKIEKSKFQSPKVNPQIQSLNQEETKMPECASNSKNPPSSFSRQNPIFDSQPSKISSIVIHHPFVRIPSLNALESEAGESGTSETDSDTICSIKSVRLRSGEAVSPSSGCKPAKLSRAENVTSNQSLEASPLSHNGVKDITPKSTKPLLSLDPTVPSKERRKSSSSGSESCSTGKDSDESRRQWLSYSKWILKGQQSMEEEEEGEKENKEQLNQITRDLEKKEENEYDDPDELDILRSMDMDEDTDDDVELDPALFEDDDEDDSGPYEVDQDPLFQDYLGDEPRMQDSLDEGYVDDYTSFEMDRNNTIEDVIYEEGAARISEEESDEMDTKAYASLMVPLEAERPFVFDSPTESPTRNLIHYKLLFEQDSPEENDERESPVTGQFRIPRNSLRDLGESGSDRSRRERGGSRKRTASLRTKTVVRDTAPNNLEENISESPNHADGDEFGGNLSSSCEYDHNQLELTDPGVFRWTISQRRSNKESSKRGLRPVIVQRQRCIQLDDRQSSDDTSNDDEPFERYSNLSSPRSPRVKSYSTRTETSSKDVRLEMEEIQCGKIEEVPREIPVVVVASPQGGTYLKPIHKGNRSHTSLRLPSPARGPKGTQRSGGSLDADLGQGIFVSFIGSRKSFEYERRLPASPGDSLTVPHHQGMDPVQRERRELPMRKLSYSSQQSSKESFPGSSPREFRRSHSERVCGSPVVDTPVRSESVRVAKGASSHGSSLRSSRSPRSPRSPRSFHFPTSELLMQDISPPERLAEPLPNNSFRLNVIPPPMVSPTARDMIMSSASPSPKSDRYCDWTSERIERQSSLDSGDLEDLLNNRRQMEQERMQMQSRWTTPSDEDEPRSKVRYNDMGSLEQVNESMVDMFEGASVALSPERQDCDRIKVQCQALWHLRSTLEEEEPEEDSDNCKMEGASSPEYTNLQPGSEVENQTTATSHTTSIESSSTSGPQTDNPTHSQPPVSSASISTTSTSFLSSEERRTSYRAILSQKLRHLEASSGPAQSSENSFDSVETDWSSTTDASRAEAITTSVDSTTDSTGDTIPHRLHQMKADSGYKSLETYGGKSSSFIAKSTQESFESQRGEKVKEEEVEEERQDPTISKHLHPPWNRTSSERRSPNKRRDLLREWQPTSLDAGLSLEVEANTADENSGKRSVLARFLRAPRPHGGNSHPGQQRFLQRDYSIDEKSDRLFREFSQAEAFIEGELPPPSRRPRMYTGRRITRRLEPGDSSPRSHRRKLSPQDSIEEENQLWEDEEVLPFREEGPPSQFQFSLREGNR